MSSRTASGSRADRRPEYSTEQRATINLIGRKKVIPAADGDRIEARNVRVSEGEAVEQPAELAHGRLLRRRLVLGAGDGRSGRRDGSEQQVEQRLR